VHALQVPHCLRPVVNTIYRKTLQCQVLLQQVAELTIIVDDKNILFHTGSVEKGLTFVTVD
jgi:hypothetical protein